MKKSLVLYFLLVSSIFILSFQAVDKEINKYWIYFDKKEPVLKKINSATDYQLEIVSQKSLARRKKVRPLEALFDETDLPINEKYITELEKSGITIKNRSRWFNAVTAFLNDTQYKNLKKLKFIKKIEPVRKFKRTKILENKPEKLLFKPQQPEEDLYDYGTSYTQIALHNIQKVHNLGITGEGVLVGFLDTGYRINHEAYEHITIRAEYDFIFNDNNTDNEPGDISSENKHGTEVLSLVGAFKEGSMIGAAFNAEFALAKTEDERWELPVEEDNFVAGIEWLESIGCDITSSSLGYNIFDDGFAYTQSDMDGQTAKVTIASEIAASKGVIVVNCAGNERTNSWGTIIAPADGPGVIAVGAVDANGIFYYYSSPGPSADGRIKPDVCAKSGNKVVSKGSYTSYSYGTGTSYSAPIVAGAVALMLSVKPSMNLAEVMEALKNTASKSRNPDNDYGWGIIDAYDALFYNGMIFIPDYNIYTSGNDYNITLEVMAEKGIDENNIFLYYSTDSVNFSPVLMTQAAEMNTYTVSIPKLSIGQQVAAYFSVKEQITGTVEVFPNIENGQYLTFKYGDDLIEPGEIIHTLPSTFILKQNYPNPFNNGTNIEFDLPVSTGVKLEIYSILGQKIKTINKGEIEAGKHLIQWDGLTENGKKAASGVYIYRLKAGQFSESKKMTLLR